jgi:hypothetical protein
MSYRRTRPYSRTALGAADYTGDPSDRAFYDEYCYDNWNNATAIQECRAVFPNGPPTRSGTGNCVEQANAQTAQLDAKTSDLGRNWNPTGFYRAADILTIVNQVNAMIHAAQSAVDKASNEPTGIQSDLRQASDDLFRAAANTLNYTRAAQAASQASRTVVNAPGLKTWVINAMNACSNAMMVAMVSSCTTPWWVSALSSFQGVFDTVWTVVKRIGGVVVAIGDTILKVAEDLPQIYTYLKYAAYAAGAAYLAIKLGEIRRKGRR